LAIAVQPAIAQQDQAKHIFHRLIPAGDTCSSCHKAIYDQWKASPHAANDVECTVCHGETTSRDFAGTPALSTCDTCHTDQVAQLKSDPFMKGKTCVSCHQAHTFVEHKKTAPAGK
jgi:DnaJ-class molecular chaperone